MFYKAQTNMKMIGSQLRDTLAEAGYRLVRREFRAVVLENDNGERELWHACDHHSGYAVQVGRWGYEFGRSLKERGPDFTIERRAGCILLRPLTSRAHSFLDDTRAVGQIGARRGTAVEVLPERLEAVKNLVLNSGYLIKEDAK